MDLEQDLKRLAIANLIFNLIAQTIDINAFKPITACKTTG